jgi:hypothetical protein
MSEYDLDLKLAELKINGFAVFEDLVPSEKIDRIYDAFMPLLDHVRQRETEFKPREVGDLRVGKGRMAHPHRYTLNFPFDPPFSDPEIYENPVMLRLLELYWGTDDFRLDCFHSNNPYPGTDYQQWHRDCPLLSPDAGMPTMPHIGIKFPLVDTCEENGSIEILPCTQYVSDSELEKKYDEVLEKGDFPTRRRLNMKRGTFWVQDPRTLHRGTPNTSVGPRPELVICYSLPWYAIAAPLEIYRENFETASERAKRLFRRAVFI